MQAYSGLYTHYWDTFETLRGTPALKAALRGSSSRRVVLGRRVTIKLGRGRVAGSRGRGRPNCRPMRRPRGLSKLQRAVFCEGGHEEGGSAATNDHRHST